MMKIKMIVDVEVKAGGFSAKAEETLEAPERLALSLIHKGYAKKAPKPKPKAPKKAKTTPKVKE